MTVDTGVAKGSSLRDSCDSIPLFTVFLPESSGLRAFSIWDYTSLAGLLRSRFHCQCYEPTYDDPGLGVIRWPTRITNQRHASITTSRSRTIPREMQGAQYDQW